MANVLMAARQTTTSTLGVITTTAQTIESGINAAGKLLQTAEVHADAYHRRSVRMCKLDEAGAFERALQSKAVDDAHFYRDLSKQLEGDSELEELYKESLSRYRGETEINSADNITQIAAE